MLTLLVPSCDVSSWNNLPQDQKLIILLKASVDPVYFWEHSLLGNLKLWDSQKQLLSEFYQLNKDGKRIKSELIFVSGRRGGKTTIAALITLYEVAKLLMLPNPQKHYNLLNNAEIMCINVAPSEDQALDTVFKRAKEILANSPFFCSFEPKLTYNTVKFPKNISFKALGSNVASGVGRTVKVFVADEVSSFKDSEKHSPEEIYFKLANSTGTFKAWNEDIRIAISSISGPGDFITTLYKQAVEDKWTWALTWWKKTWELNPEMSLEILDEERKRNPDIFDRDYGAEEGVDSKSFFNEIKLDEVKKRAARRSNIFIGEPPIDKRERKLGFIPEIDQTKLDAKLYSDAVEFFIATDPAVRNDAFGLSVGYYSINGNIIIIGSTVIIAAKGDEIKTSNIAELIKPIIEKLPVSGYIFDVYMHSDLQSMVKDMNIPIYQHTLKLPDWILLRNDLYDDYAQVPYGDLLFKEYYELLLIRSRDVDHPSNGSKDQADSTCQLISFIRRREDSQRQRKSIPMHYVATFNTRP